jgi:CPA1 family monovalent cation:H+ antiporter
MNTLARGDLIVVLGLLVATSGLLVLAPRVRIPYPILLTLGGLALGFVPGIPDFKVSPEFVLVGVLPPLLYSAAFFTSLRDLRANMRPIGLLALGLVLTTTVIVAVVAHTAIGMSWASAFVLGAVVSPTDPIAATAIASRLGVPRRLVVIVEGESLVNDATALVALRVAVVAAVSGTFSLWHAGLQFVGVVAGGLAVGLAVGWLVRQARRRIDDPPVEVTISLLTGYFAFIPADLLHVSGVVAVVTAGVYLGWHTPELTTPDTRILGDSMWEITTFVLNALLFVLLGLQLPAILDALQGEPAGKLIWWAVLVSGTVIVGRILWVFPATYVPRFLSARLRARDPYPPWQAPALISWMGMRGAVSLAAALAVPLTTDTGSAFPDRELIVFLAFAVVIATLVVQGLSLPIVIRLLGLEDDGLSEKEETKARIRAAEAALQRLEELAGEEWVNDDTAERLRGAYGFRRRRFAARFDGDDDGAVEQRSQSYQRLRAELLEAERQAVLELRRDGRISDEVMRRLERDLDLEVARLDIPPT